MSGQAYSPFWRNRSTAAGCADVSAAPFDRPDRLQRLHFLGGHGGGPLEPAGITADLLGLPQGAQITYRPPAGLLLGQLAPFGGTDARQWGSDSCCAAAASCAAPLFAGAALAGAALAGSGGHGLAGQIRALARPAAKARPLTGSRASARGAQQTETVQPGVPCSLRAKANAL
jgi:hypothetical protein